MDFTEITVFTNSENAEVVAYFLQEVCLDGVTILDKNDLYQNASWDYKDDSADLAYANEVMVKGYWGDNVGAQRKYYTITERGKQQYELNKREWENAKRLIDILIK